MFSVSNIAIIFSSGSSINLSNLLDAYSFNFSAPFITYILGLEFIDFVINNSFKFSISSVFIVFVSESIIIKSLFNLISSIEILLSKDNISFINSSASINLSSKFDSIK